MKLMERRLRRMEKAKSVRRNPVILVQLDRDAPDELVKQRAQMLAELKEEGVSHVLVVEEELNV